MKIVAINAVGLVGETPKGGWTVELKPEDSVHTLIAVHTDGGLIGYGSVFTNHLLVDAALKVLAPLWQGELALEPERVSEKLAQNSFWMGMGGSITHTISGIDIALWDIIGKATGMPIHKLLGGCFRPKVLAYASGLYFRNVDRLTDEAVEEARGYAAQGFRAIKMRIGLGALKRDIERVAAVRAAIGQDVQLIVDADHSYNVAQAISIGRELEKLGVYWFEEPVSPEDIDGYIEVSRALDVAIAGGENDFTKYGFRQILERRAMDIIQPDVCAAGGITECRKIAALAQAYSTPCVPHAWGTAIGLAATLQFLAALPECPPCLVPMPPMLEYEPGSNPLRDDLAGQPFVQKQGWVDVPTGSGLGIEVDRTVLERYRVA